MKKSGNYRTMMGFLIYMLANITDRFIIKIPNLIYVVIIVVAIIFVLSGWIKSSSS